MTRSLTTSLIYTHHHSPIYTPIYTAILSIINIYTQDSMSPPQHPYNANFWDFVQSYDPNQGTGRGVDHNNETSLPSFMSAFPFGAPSAGLYGGPHPPHPPHPSHPPHPPHPPHPHPPHPPHGHGHGPGPGPRGPPPPPEADGFVWGPWAAPDARTRSEQRRAQPESRERGDNAETRDSSETLNVPDPEEVVPEENQCGARPQWPGRGRGRDHGGPRGGRGGRGRGGFSYGPHQGHGAAPFDLSGLFRGLAGHPFFRNIREQFPAGQNAPEPSDSSFSPPLDIFNTEKAYVIHVALPGAKKEDIGVNWDADRSMLKIAGVVHRPGDEAFLSTLTLGERKVGMFERNVTLPPEGSDERDEVDGLGITAKMEDGILLITVPKAEKEWTEIHKIDIE
ncbi:hypothetical protein F66182_2902 [Fusarium sp. NRRL 66182]|nr:hypothetical protein F66182_2902 [Fusarium sp. NRRL 66182]